MVSIARVVVWPFKFLKWLLRWAVAALVLTCLFSTPVEGISELQRGAISQNCATIKQTLGQLQKVDSRTRSYLGTTYETITNRFITPLNLRLVKNNLPTLSSIQTDFSIEQAKFRNAYTDYMRELETLIVMDCTNKPDEFYGRLVITREKRAILREATVKLAALADKQYTAVEELRSKL